MSEVKLKPTGGGAGSISLKAPAATTSDQDYPLVLPADDGTADQYLKTNGSGTLSWATVAGSNHVLLDDAKFIKAGTDGDLWVGHDASHSYINHNGTGSFFIQSSGGFYVQKYGTAERLINANNDGSVELLYDAVKKFETTSAGITITGQPGAEMDTSYAFYNKSNTGTIVEFRTGGVAKGSIGIGGSDVSFNTSSDYRLKENVAAISDGITRVKQLKPSKFNWIVDDTNTLIDGFLAHEVSSVIPNAITGTKDEVKTIYYVEGDTIPDDKDVGDVKDSASPVYQGIDQSKLVPLLTAALQEAIAKIETLETKVAALEAAS